MALRARIVLQCAEDVTTISGVAERLDVSRATVSKWRSRFLLGRLDGLLDEARPGRPRTIADDDIEQVITKTLESTPSEAASRPLQTSP
ncbi:helix-turn-helix domain-containing protein [Kribbella sp. CA-253562]|uniref:helix-turn-helix domain-containing protein n=1 Tax=Kribbella sp. CA-253562 TaxID=3239942 RepID=UPI003D92DDBA